MCCYATHLEDNDSQPATLRNLRPTSAASVALPSSAVPHGVPEGVDVSDAHALREIFSSSSSVRGYRAAVTPSDMISGRSTSFDAEFRIPNNRSPTKKTGGRLEALGHNIKQKLSEARLSKSSSRNTFKDENAAFRQLPSNLEKKPDEHALLLGTSHRSTGLSDILKSRNVSEGGYDSDAKSIETAMLRSNPGTVRVSPGHARQMLLNIEVANNIDVRPVDALGCNREQEKTPTPILPGRGRSKSTPNPATPTKITFEQALQIGGDESPADVLRRLSAGVANGTVKLPDTPTLKALRMRSVADAQQDWRLSFVAPRRASSLNKSGWDVQGVLQALNDRLEKAKRESLVSNGKSEKHSSLISDIDPSLLQYISRYGGTDSPKAKVPDDTDPASSDVGNSTVSIPLEGTKDSIPGDEKGQDVTEYLGTSAHNSTLSLPGSTKEVQRAESDRDSVHLFNMRISQRLASNSVMPILSPSNSNIGSFNSPSGTSGLSGRPPSFGRFPSWIANEHNRKPSDPQTRKLFEKGGYRRDPPKWKSVNSVRSFNAKTTSDCPARDDTSSFYLSDAGLPTSGAVSLNATRRNSLKNSNSLAIGGRSASSGLPRDNGSAGQLPNADESAWLKGRAEQVQRMSEDTGSWLDDDQIRKRGRSVSMPRTSRFREDVSTPTPKTRKFRGSSEVNEAMSEISLNATRDRRNEAFSEISVDRVHDRRNEILSEAEFDSAMLQNGYEGERNPRRSSAGWLSQGKREGWGFDFVDKTPERSGSDEANVNPKVSGKVYESATNMWERALKRARDDEACGLSENPLGTLAVPQFDRLGRRKSRTGSTASNVRDRQDHSTPSLARSRSGDCEGSFDLDSHQRLCSAAKAPLSRPRSIAGESSNDRDKRRGKTVKETPRKKSLLDIRRFTTVSLPPSYSNREKTPIKDLFSAWTRFPSHAREQRNGPASGKDDVKVTDFQAQADRNERLKAKEKSRSALNLAGTLGSQGSLSTADLGIRTPGSWRMIGLRGSKRKSRSMMFNSKDGRIVGTVPVRKKNRGIVQSIKRLYRSSNSDLRSYAHGYGHRSSLSVGGRIEYPELEVLPGEGLLGRQWIVDAETDRYARKRNKRLERTTKSKCGLGPGSEGESDQADSVKAGSIIGSDEKDRGNGAPWERKEGIAMAIAAHAKEMQRQASEGSLEMPPKITDCEIGRTLGEKGSCEDVSREGGVDGAGE